VIEGDVTADGVPQVRLRIGDRDFVAVVDTGYNGDFELPDALREIVAARPIGRVISNLAAGMTIEEDYYAAVVPFDGVAVEVEVTFVTGDEILVGTRPLRDHLLTIDFPAGTVRLERTAEDR
jgi:predicted aspartyl protease